MVCENCAKSAANKYHGGYSMTCPQCRERFLLAEPCKLMRQAYVKSMEKWGDVPDWKREPSCGCVRTCKRRQYQEHDPKKGKRNADTPY